MLRMVGVGSWRYRRWHCRVEQQWRTVGNVGNHGDGNYSAEIHYCDEITFNGDELLY